MKDYMKSWQRVMNGNHWKYMADYFPWDSRLILGIKKKPPVCAVPGKCWEKPGKNWEKSERNKLILKHYWEKEERQRLVLKHFGKSKPVDFNETNWGW